MVHWIYIFECEDNYIYVGETTRLYRRFGEHIGGRGGSNTSKHSPSKLVGLYKVSDNFAFIEYRNSIKSGEFNRFLLEKWGENDGDNLLIENHITERLFYERRNNHVYGPGNEWYRIRGGKYTKDNTVCFAKNPTEIMSSEMIIDRPLCKCNYPSEVKLSKDKTKVYFVCALKNVWDDFYGMIDVGEPCDFWELYTDDKDVRENYEIIKIKSKESWVTNIPLSRYKINTESCISCEKSGYFAIFNGGVRRLCQHCMIKNYESLKEKYSNKWIFD